MSIYAFRRPLSYTYDPLDLKRQEEAIKAMAKLRGVEVNSASDGGGWLDAQGPDDRYVLDELIGRLRAGDILIVSELRALGSRPSVLMDKVSRIIGKGAELLVADMRGELDLSSLRRYVSAFEPLETALAQKEADLVRQAKEHRREMEDWQKAYDREITSLLQRHNISLGDALRPKATLTKATAKNSARGAELKRQREALGLTLEDAGKLVKPALNKGSVSRFERAGAGERIGEYEAFLNAQRVQRERKANGAAA